MTRTPYPVAPDQASAAGQVREIVLGDDPDVRALMAAGAGLVSPVEYTVHDDAPAQWLAAVLPDGWQLRTALIPAGEETAPKAVAQTVALHDLPSWSRYINQLSEVDAHPHVYADQGRSRLTAILDPSTQDGPSWARHRAALQLTVTEDWKAWLGNHAKLLPQVTFAEHVEEQAHTFKPRETGEGGPAYPDAATMLEIAETFRTTQRATFESSARLQDGQRQLVYREENTAPTAGQGARNAQLQVPDRFRISVQVWERIPVAVTLVAMFRWRVQDGHLSLGYRLVRAADAQERAWQAFCQTAQDGTAGEEGVPESEPLPGGTLFLSGEAPTLS